MVAIEIKQSGGAVGLILSHRPIFVLRKVFYGFERVDHCRVSNRGISVWVQWPAGVDSHRFFVASASGAASHARFGLGQIRRVGEDGWEV
jgi:hypothetical protein